MNNKEIILNKDRQTAYLTGRSSHAWQWALEIDTQHPTAVTTWGFWVTEQAEVALNQRCLSHMQSAMLWQAVIASSATGQSAVNQSSLARWSSEAWSLLQQYQINPDVLQNFGPESRTLLDWGRHYDSRLRSHGWLDRDAAHREFTAAVARGSATIPWSRLELLSLADLTPVDVALLNAFEQAGIRIGRRSEVVHDAQIRVVGANERGTELSAAIRHATGIYASDANARVALVIPSHVGSRGEIERQLSSEIPAEFNSGRLAIDMAPVAAALNALTMLSANANMASFCRWLRSPFMHGQAAAELGSLAKLELKIRDALLGQLPFHTAYLEAGLESWLEAASIAAHVRLQHALHRRMQTQQLMLPPQWAQHILDLLADLQWLVDCEDGEIARQAVVSTTEDLAELSAIAGPISFDSALRIMRSLASRPVTAQPLPISGVHIFDSIEEVGPGYTEIVAAGFSNVAWPPRKSPNPLLPRAIQAEFGLPWATPLDTAQRTQRSIARIATLAPRVRFSWATQDDQQHARCTPLLAKYCESNGIDLDAIGDFAPTSDRTGDANTSPEIEILTDKPAQFISARLPGGASLLDKQAACPLRAFIEYRLKAREPEPWTRGLPLKVRGQLIHLAAEKLFGVGISRDWLQGLDEIAIEQKIENVAEVAIQKIFTKSRKHLAILAAFEKQRLIASLRQLLSAELVRSDFEIVQTESKISVNVGEHELQGRIDRVDRLTSGGLVITDYKTGRPIQNPQWLGEQIENLQLPLYSTAIGDQVVGLVLAGIRPDKTTYRGFWTGDAFPDRPLRLEEGSDLDTLRVRWVEQIAALVHGFVEGDTSIDREKLDPAIGNYAPLTRVYETLRLLEAD